MENLPFNYEVKDVFQFYCPVCKSLRRSFYRPSPQPKHYFSLVILGVTLTLALKPLFGYKAAALIVPIWTAFELIYRARARQSLLCRKCGFDPYLYKFDPKAAGRKVKEHTDSLKVTAPAQIASKKDDSETNN